MEAFNSVLDDAIARIEISIERLHRRIDELCQVLNSMTFDGSIKWDRDRGA